MNQRIRKAILAGMSVVIAGAIFWPEDRDMQATANVEENASAPIPAPMVTELPVAQTLEEGVRMDLRRLVDQARASLVSVAQARSLSPEKMHQPRLMVGKASVALGEVREFWESNPSVRALALDFYRECASDLRLITSLQALCLTEAQELAADMGQDPGIVQAPREARLLVAHMRKAMGERPL